MSALRTFMKDVYAPRLHVAFAAAWFLALEGTLRVVEGRAGWSFDLATLAAIATLFLVLFFLRVVDELKDLDYDRVHNPDRPLVRGAVTVRQLVGWMAGTALIVVAINAPISPWLVAIAIADMVWGLVLVALERRSPRVRNGMFLNLLVTYPVNIALSVYGYAFVLARSGGAPSLRGSLVIVAFAFAFLNYEILRKTVWPHLAEESERLYSHALGGHGAIGLAFGFALGATAILATLLSTSARPWLSVFAFLPLIPATAALAKFLRHRDARVKLAPLGMQFLLLFYLGLCIVGFTGNALSLGAS